MIAVVRRQVFVKGSHLIHPFIRMNG